MVVVTGPADGVAVTLRARGHPAVRASHAKTVELTAGEQITARATCVVGVAAELEGAALEGWRGPVVVILQAGGHEDHIRAVANPRYRAGDRLVVRRSGYRSEETFATGADKAAADLDRGLTEALAVPGAPVRVTVRAAAAPSAATAELLVWRTAPALPPGRGDLERELSRAAAVLEARPGLLRRLGDLARALPDGPASAEDCRAALAGGQAVAVLGDPATGGPAATLLEAAVVDGVPVRAVDSGDPLDDALLAASAAGGPWAFLGVPPSRRSDRERQLDGLARLGAAGVWDGPAARVRDLLADVAAHRPGTAAGLTLSPGTPGEVRRHGRPGQLLDERWPGAGRDRVLLVLPRAGEGHERPGLPQAPLVAALLDEGVTPRTLANALARLPGVSRREAYAWVLDLRDGRD